MVELLTSLEGRVGTVVFNRPDCRNAISKPMWKKIPRVLAELVDNGASVIVITGEGGAFCAGADITELIAVADEASAKELSECIASGIEAIAQVRAATIAMIDGPCLGGGCLVAAACDLRYATQHAVFSLPVAKLGIVLDQTNVLRVAGLIGPARTKELIYGAATIDSGTALSIGLINDYFDDKDELIEFVQNKARIFSNNSSASILGVKATINSLYGPNRDLPEALRGPTIEEVTASYNSADLKERLARIFQGQNQPQTEESGPGGKQADVPSQAAGDKN